MLALFLGACAPNQRPLKTVSPTISEPESSVRADASAIAYLIQAERFFIQERFQKAADHYRLALIHDPYSAELHLRLARSLGQLNQWLSALKVLEKGFVPNPITFLCDWRWVASTWRLKITNRLKPLS